MSPAENDISAIARVHVRAVNRVHVHVHLLPKLSSLLTKVVVQA